MAREVVIGIDAGTSAVKTVILEKKKGDNLPSVIGTGISPSYGLRKGIIINPPEAAASIKESLKQAKNSANINQNDAFIAVAGSGIQGVRSKGSILVSRADHEITDGDLKRVLTQSETQLNRASSSFLLNRTVIHSFPICYRIDGEQVIGDSVGMKGEKLEIETLFITCQTQHFNNLLKSMEMAGVNIEDFSAAPWAMSHATLNQQEKEVGSLIINIGGDTSSIIVFEESTPISMEVFPIGSNHITYDIARGFQIPLEEAEEMKLSYDPEVSAKKKLAGIIEPRLNDIFELVESHLTKINRAKLLPAGAILTGGGSNLSRIAEIGKEVLSLPVQVGQPKFIASAQNSKHSVLNPIWSVALGICLENMKEKREPGHGRDLPSLGSKKGFFGWTKNLLRNLLP